MRKALIFSVFALLGLSIYTPAKATQYRRVGNDFIYTVDGQKTNILCFLYACQDTVTNQVYTLTDLFGPDAGPVNSPTAGVSTPTQTTTPIVQTPVSTPVQPVTGPSVSTTTSTPQTYYDMASLLKSYSVINVFASSTDITSGFKIVTTIPLNLTITYFSQNDPDWQTIYNNSVHSSTVLEPQLEMLIKQHPEKLITQTETGTNADHLFLLRDGGVQPWVGYYYILEGTDQQGNIHKEAWNLGQDVSWRN